VTDDKIKTKASAAGVEIEAAGGGAARLTNALADALSPFTQPMGLLGDEIESFRIHRRIKAIETLKRASELQEEIGIEPHPVSPKLLSNWIEKASLESDDDQSLSELYALLLAKSPEDFSPIHALCIDILGKIGPLEARVFQKICENKSDKSWPKEGIYPGIIHFKRSPQSVFLTALLENFEVAVDIEQFLRDADSFKSSLQRELSVSGCAILDCQVYREGDISKHQGKYEYRFGDGLYEEFGQSKILNTVEILSHNGLVYEGVYDFNTNHKALKNNLNFFVNGVSLTRIGVMFANNCFVKSMVTEKSND